MSAADLESLRLWLRLFTTTTLVERQLDSALKREFGSTLPRFDLLAQLERTPDGLRMGELSERILTTGGNVTWLVRALEAEKLVTRRVSPTDKRAAIVRLTAAGKRHFAAMAQAHERWIADIFADLSPDDRRALHARLGVVKDRVRPPRSSS
jgi:DNA-binding MarR family transcriptional regulator